MKTVKLYDENAYLDKFSATVVSCEKAENGYALILDKTSFFPEEGGQLCDTGLINGAAVNYVKEENGIITHFVDRVFSVGQTVEGFIDFPRRFSFMQNHSGEHIVSGIVFKKYGFNNVGFHLNEQFATVDFDGILTREMLNAVEESANRAVFENREIKAYYPSERELETINYRSKKEIEGPLRIVDITGVDVCACCAPHVARTGEIGMIKLLDFTKMRGGTRVILKCGRYALLDYQNKYENISDISVLLSADRDSAAQAVHNLWDKFEKTKQTINELTRKLIENTVETKKDTYCFYEKDYNMKQLQMLTDGLHKTHGGTRAALSGGGDSLNFCLCGEEAELESIFAEFKTAFNVRGGGRGGMMQGSVSAKAADVIKFFEERLK